MNNSQSRQGFKSRDLENERLQTDIDHHLNQLALADHKLTILNDLKQDICHSKSQTESHKIAREELQNHIQTKAIEISQHSTDSQTIQDGLIKENQNLKSLIQDLEVQASQVLVKHNGDIKSLNEAHLKKENANLSLQNTLKKSHTDRVDALIKEREAAQAIHTAAMKLNQDQNVAKDAKYITDLKNADTLLKDTVKGMEARHAQQLKDLQAALEKVSANYVSDLKTFAANHDRVVSDLNTKLQSQLQQSNEEKNRRDIQYKTDLKQMEDNHNKFISDMNNQNAKNLRDLESKYNAQIADVNQRNRQNVNDIEARHNQLTTDLQKRHQQEMDALEARYQQAIAELQAQNKSNIDKMTKIYEDKLTALKQQCDDNLRQLEAKYNGLLSDLKGNNKRMIEDMQRTYNDNIRETQQKNSQHVDSLETANRKQVSDLQEANRQNLATAEQKQAELISQAQTAYRASLNAKDREAQTAATQYAQDLDARNKAHQAEVNALMKVNVAQDERNAALLSKRDTDYISSLDALTKQHAQKMMEFNNERIATIEKLRAEINAANAARDAERKVAQTLQINQESRHKEWQAEEANRHHMQITNLQARYDALVLLMQKEGDAFRQQIEESRSRYELRINELEIMIKSLTMQCSVKDARILELENLLRRLQDIEQQYLMICEHARELEKAKNLLKEDLEGATSYISDLEEKYYKSQLEALGLLKMLQASESSCEEMQNEIEVLRNYIIDLKSRIAVYIPVKNDSIDKRIAEYINNYPDRQKLKIMFMRESEGVYQFGSKKVSVKVDKDKINIRVGGGYLSIDEFLDQYTPAELEKLERKDPMKRFQEKVAVNKTLAGHDIVRGSSPDSPIRGSPKKRAL